MSKRENSNVPQIRFKGFDGEWQLKSLSDLIALENGFAFKSRNFSARPTSTVVLTPGNVKVGGGFQHGKGQYYLENQNIPNKFIFEAGDIFVTMTDLTPTSQALGFPAIVPKDSNIYLHNQRLGKLVGYHGHEGFLFYSLCVPKVQKEVVSTASGTTVKHTSPSKFLNRDFCLPTKDEQAKVGVFFQELDQLIQQHLHKHDKLVTLKQAMLQKMFPQPGATAPEIRFKEFEGEWEEKKLGELMPITSAARVHKHEWTRSGVPFFRTSDVVSLYKGEENAKAFISLDLYEKLSDKIGRIKCGDILITGGGSIGIPFLAKSDDPLYFKDADLLWLKVPGSVDSIYLYVFFSSVRFRGYLGSISHIGTIGHFTVEQAKKTPIAIPLQAEQKKIGTYFRQLDELIARHATQLEKLKQVKVACLEKMFI